MKRFAIILLLLLPFAVIAQSSRKLPYPVILVHGLTGDDGSWFEVLQEYEKLGINTKIDFARKGAAIGSRIDFNLNYDNDNSRAFIDYTSKTNVYGDVEDRNSPIDPNTDIFVINFNNGLLSNQSAIYKQGFALGIAIKKVLAATKAQKVILMGHSMGGLAIRQYLQESRFQFWGDTEHKVHRVITVGTPHGGSDVSFSEANIGGIITSIANVRSEAVRDLRSSHFISGKKGVYLFGGAESDATFGATGLVPYFNTDINCNGMNDSVLGINVGKANTLPTDIQYLCIQSNYLNTNSDIIVTTFSQNLNNFIKKSIGGVNYDIAVSQTLSGSVSHLSQLSTRQAEIVKYAMLQDKITVIPNQQWFSFFVGFSNAPTSVAYASYFFEIPNDGDVTITTTAPSQMYNQQLIIYENNGAGKILFSGNASLALGILKKGQYFVEFYANHASNVYGTFAFNIRYIPQILSTEPPNDFVVYPNPSNGKMTIEGINPKQIFCYDMLGKAVDFDVDGQNLSIHQPGTYLLKIDGQSKRIVVY